MADSKILCKCYHLTKSDIEAAVDQGAACFKDVKKMTKAGAACGKCKKEVKTYVKEYMAAKGIEYKKKDKKEKKKK